MDVTLELRERSRRLLSQRGHVRSGSPASLQHEAGHGLTLDDLLSQRSTVLPSNPQPKAPRPALHRGGSGPAKPERKKPATGSIEKQINSKVAAAPRLVAPVAETVPLRSILAQQPTAASPGLAAAEQPNARPHGIEDATLLGYDWIAGMLDNGSPLDEKGDAFFEELNAFRKVNYNECHAPLSLFNDLYGRKKPGDAAGTNHAQERSGADGDDFTFALEEGEHGESRSAATENVQPAYRINERLFPELIDDANLAESVGPANGRYVRISVPGRFIKPEIKLPHHRRDSFDPSNSCALSRHCIMGWETAKPASLPPQSSADLRSSTNKKLVHPLFIT